MPDKKLVGQGACKYCGQVQAVSGCKTAEEADKKVTQICECKEAIIAREEGEKETKRESTLKDAKRDIGEFFAQGAEERGEISVEKDVEKLLYDIAVMVYDEKLRSVTITVTQGVKAKISKTDQGKLIIQRNDSTTQKREYGQ